MHKLVPVPTHGDVTISRWHGHTYTAVQLATQQIVVGCIFVHRLNGVFIDAKINQQATSHIAIAIRTIQILCTAQAQHHSAFVVKLVTLGMATEVIVIVQNQNTCLVAHLLTIEPGSGQPTHAGTHNNQIVVFLLSGITVWFLTFPGQCVRHLKGPLVTATHAG